MKLTADNLCALLVILSMVVALTNLILDAIDTNGLLALACLVLLARHYYVKAKTP